MEQSSVLTVEAMKQVEQRWATAKDIDSLVALYADDATFDFLNAEPAEPAVGKDAIRAAHQAMKDEGDSTPDDKTTIEPREAVVLGNWGYTSGTWTDEHPFGRVDSGTYLHVFKLVDGEVKLFRHLPYVADSSYPASQQDTDDKSSLVMSENTLTVEALKQIEQRWATAKDMDSMMAIFANDAMFDHVNGQPVVGKDAIRAIYVVDEGEMRTAENQEAVVLGSWGYSSGNWTVEHPDGRIDKGTYLNVIKLVDGEAKMFRQIFDVKESS